VLAGAVVACIALPVVPILLGVLLVLAALAHAVSPQLRPWLRPVLQFCFDRADRASTSLFAVATGVLLVLCGSAGAELGGRWRTEWVQSRQHDQFVEERANGLLERAQRDLDRGHIDDAEFTLMEAGGIDEGDPRSRREVERMLGDLRRSQDAAAILELLVRLPDEDFRAFEREESVPAGLEFDDRALTYRAVGIARAQLEEARQARARR